MADYGWISIVLFYRALDFRHMQLLTFPGRLGYGSGPSPCRSILFC